MVSQLVICIGDPMLIPSLPSEAVSVLPPGQFWSESEGTVAVQLVIHKVIQC